MKPILFNAEMVRAFLAGRKQVTRRVMKPQPADTDDCQHEMQTYDKMLPQFYKGDCSCVCRKCGYGTLPNGESIFQPPYRPGDILYVRETWAAWSRTYGAVPVLYYKADKNAPDGIKWRPSIHMPREAARIFLRVTDVRVERLQDITELDIMEKEGVTVDFPQPKPSYMSLAYTETRLKPAVRKSFADLWDSTIKPADHDLYGWDANPWVWVIELERISREEAGL